MSEVSFINGSTKLYGIVGSPIAQVRSPEMATWELQRRGLNAILVPLHVREDAFNTTLPALLGLVNLHGLIFTIPFKARAAAFASALGPHAQVQVAMGGGFNALARTASGQWVGEMFDGLGCVQAFKRRGIAIAGKRLMLLGLGGAGSAIAAAMALEKPASLRLFDVNAQRCEQVAQAIARLIPSTEVQIGPPQLSDADILLNATPIGMLADARLPFEVGGTPPKLAPSLTVFDAIVTPATTPLLALAEQSGCAVVRGREMMLGQMARVVDFFEREGQLK